VGVAVEIVVWTTSTFLLCASTAKGDTAFLLTDGTIAM